MEIHFRTLRGEPFKLKVNDSLSVKSIKELLQKEFHLIPSNICLIDGTKILNDKTVIDPKALNHKFIVIHENDQSLRENVIPSSMIKTSFSILRTNSEEPTPKNESWKRSYNPRNGKPDFNNHKIDYQYEQSDQFQEILKSFVAMGLNKDESLNNLRRFNYDTDAAINYSITGVMPTEETEYEEEEEKVQKEEIKPKPKPRPREYDVSGLNNYNFGQFNGEVQRLNNTEKYALLRVLNEHRNLDVDFVVQIFFSCSKDYTTTTHFFDEENH